jgi:predicted RND superfamily exporter protein
MSSLFTGVVNTLVDYRWGWAFLWGAVALAGVIWAHEVPVDRRVDRLLGPANPVVQSYQTLGRVFGAYDPIVVAYDAPALMNPGGEGIERIRRLEACLDRMPGIAETISLADLDELVQESLRQPITQPSFLSRQILEVLEGFTHSHDRKTVAVVCLVEKGADRTALIQQLRLWLQERQQEYPQASLVGEPVLIEEGTRMLERDGTRLNFNASLIMALVLLFSFRSLRWMLIAGLLVQGSLAITRLAIVLTHSQLSIVSTIFSAVITVIAVAAIMHWIVRFREALVECGDREAAVRLAMGRLLTPMVWACLTDAAGFAALMVAQVGPVRDFGWIMIMGSLSVLLGLLAVVPCLALIPLPRFFQWLDADPRPGWQEKIVDQQLVTSFAKIRTAPWRFGGVMIFLGLLASLGMQFTRFETDFIQNFKSNSPVVRDYRFFEEHLGGAGVWDILVPLEGPIDWDSIRKIRELEQRLETEVVVHSQRGSEPGITHTLSIADAVVAVIPVDLSSVPVVGDFVVRTGLQQIEQRMPSWLETMYGQDPESGQQYVRILVRSNQQQSAEQSEFVIEQVREICDSVFPAKQPGGEVQVTGWFVLLTRLVSSLMADQLLTFLVAATAIFIMMVLATQRLRLALVAMVPNLLPIGVVLGVLGWLGVPLNMGVALIAAVSIGLSIDNTIHYLAVFQAGVRRGLDRDQAILEAHHRAGVASVFSTLALTAGFATLCLSDFVPTVYFGGLVCASMLGGVIGNLLLLPLLIQWVTRRSFSNFDPTH